MADNSPVHFCFKIGMMGLKYLVLQLSPCWFLPPAMNWVPVDFSQLSLQLTELLYSILTILLHVLFHSIWRKRPLTATKTSNNAPLYSTISLHIITKQLTTINNGIIRVEANDQITVIHQKGQIMSASQPNFFKKKLQHKLKKKKKMDLHNTKQTH